MFPAQLSLLRHLAAIAALALSLGWSPVTAFADDNAAAAKAHYATGVQHFNLSEYELALSEFKEAYRNKSDPVFLFNIGQCHRKLGHADEAITFYQSYLREAPDAKNRREVEHRIEELKSLRDAENATIATSAATRPGPSPTSLDAQSIAVAETSSPITLPAGTDLDARNDRMPQPATPVYRRWWFWTAVGAVAAGAATLAVIMTTRDPTDVPGTTLGAQRALP